MTNEYTDDTYTVGMWYLPGNNQDWLATVTRDKSSLVERYILRYRFRYYVTNDPWDDKDTKSWYRGELATTEEMVIHHMSVMVDGMVAMGYLAPKAKAYKLIIRGGQDKVFEALRKQPWAHMMTPEEREAYKARKEN